MAKNTYGTGSFVLMQTGANRVASTSGMLTTVAWRRAGRLSYALEGAIFITGAALQWLRDGLGIIDSAAEAGPLASSVADSGGVFLVPAFVGLGAPHWDPYARGTIVGLTRGSGRAQLVRAAVEAMAYQTRDVVEAMERDLGAAHARAAGRRWRRGDGRAVPVPGRPSRHPGAPAAPDRDAPRSAPLSSPASAPACGRCQT